MPRIEPTRQDPAEGAVHPRFDFFFSIRLVRPFRLPISSSYPAISFSAFSALYSTLIFRVVVLSQRPGG